MLLVIDNYDSFTYNLVQYLGELGAEPEVVRNDAVTVAEVERLAPAAIVLGPGPGTPDDAGITLPVIKALGATTPILGVCLGHQAIGAAYGARVIRAPRGVMHGKVSRVVHEGTGIFDGVPNPVEVMRYHSLVVSSEGLPSGLRVTATAADDPTEIHALEHAEHPVWGVQFHPESIGTPDGMRMLKNFLTRARSRARAAVGVCALVLAAGAGACGGDAAFAGGDTPWTFEVDSTADSVQVRISGSVPDRVVRELVLELQVGAQDGTEEETFGTVSDVIGTADGGLLIYDSQARLVRTFGPDGQFVRQVGGQGGGPGEYEWINGITRTPNGEFVLWDANGARLNVYSPGGDFVRHIRLPITGWFRFDGLKSDRDGRLFAWAPLRRDPATGRLLEEGFVALDSTGAVTDTVAFPLWKPEPPALVAQSADGGSTRTQQLPWMWGSESVLLPQGGLASGAGPEYVFYILPRNGRPIRVEREYEPVPVSRTEASERKAQITQQMRTVNPAWDWNGPEFPTAKPAYRQLLAGNDGRVWVRLWTAGVPIPAAELPPARTAPDAPPPLTTREPELYDVYSADGRLLGRVRPPARTRLLRMEGDLVWGVTQDSLDVSYAVRYRITPTLSR